MEIAGHAGKRSVKADDFFQGLFETALGAHDVLTAIREIKGRQQGPISMSPHDKITGVDIQSFDPDEES